jgi:hypothetical protein
MNHPRQEISMNDDAATRLPAPSPRGIGGDLGPYRAITMTDARGGWRSRIGIVMDEEPGPIGHADLAPG